jgi:glycosyltransferase involved in cell wall biosynthesis
VPVIEPKLINVDEMSGPDNINLSVIIPTKNRPHLLQRAMASVAMQTYPDFEVCIADNNTDAEISKQVQATVKDFRNRYPKIKWLYIRSIKLYAGGTRNDGIAITQGKYIIFLDDDDELLPNSIKLRMDEMHADAELALLYCAGYSKIYPYPFKMYRYYHYSKKHQDKLMMMSCSSIMINRDFFHSNDLYFDEQLSRMEDYDLCRKVIEKGLKVKSIPLPLVQINLHPETRMSSQHLISYDFKHRLINRWGQTADDEIYGYAEGVYVWRKCFGMSNAPYGQMVETLKRDFGRTPNLTFKLKYKLVSFSPKLYLALYHMIMSLLQKRKNEKARKS